VDDFLKARRGGADEMNEIIFANNYTDLSTNQGFQFEFTCNRCGTKYRTPFKLSLLSIASEVLAAASGLLGSSTYIGDGARPASWEKSHDAAFEQAIKDIKPNFVQCSGCSSWVCRDGCYSPEEGLCRDCAPAAEASPEDEDAA
jgi:hypothetical protein